MDYDLEDIENLLWSGAEALLGERAISVGYDSLPILHEKVRKAAIVFGLNNSKGQCADPRTILNRCKAWMRIYETYQNKRALGR